MSDDPWDDPAIAEWALSWLAEVEACPHCRKTRGGFIPCETHNHPVDLGTPDLNRAANTVRAVADRTPPAWWWLSFADPERPEGTQFLGACLVKASNVPMALRRAHELHINPGGQVAAWGPFTDGEIPADQKRNVLLGRDDIFGGAISLGDMEPE